MPTEVDSSSSDNLFAKVGDPSKPVKTTKVTLQRSGHVDPDEVDPHIYIQKWIDRNKEKDTYDDEITGHPDGPIYLGDNALLRKWMITMGPARIESGKYEGLSYSEIYSKDKQYANCLGRCLKLDEDKGNNYNLDPTIKTYIAYSIIRSATFR